MDKVKCVSAIVDSKIQNPWYVEMVYLDNMLVYLGHIDDGSQNNPSFKEVWDFKLFTLMFFSPFKISTTKNTEKCVFFQRTWSLFILPQLNKTTGLLGSKYRKFILFLSKLEYLAWDRGCVMTLTRLGRMPVRWFGMTKVGFFWHHKMYF